MGPSSLEAMEDLNSVTVGTLKRRVRQRKRIHEIIRTKLQRNLSCSGSKLKSTLTGFFPVVKWLPKYKVKDYIWGDLMSGLIVGIILIPQAIAYCQVGTHCMNGVGDQKNCTLKRNCTFPEMCRRHTIKPCIVCSPQVLMAVLRLGFVSVYLSVPMLDGFATGASCTILTVQAKYLLGLKIPRHQGYGTVVVTWINIFKNIHKTNFCDLITSAICIIVLVAGKEIQDRYKDRLKIPLPTELVVVAVATIVSHFADLNGQFSSSISGAIPTGFIPPKVPSIELMPRVACNAIPLAVISFAFTVSLSEMFAKKNGYTVRPNQEMIAIGFCNVIPSFFHSFTTSAALAKTMVKDSTEENWRKKLEEMQGRRQIDTFKTVLKDYKEVGVNVILACCNTPVIDSLRRGSFFGAADKDMEQLSFHTIHSAVCFATCTTQPVNDSSV
uniref:Solute carrier family 26 member 1 n=1 Tax=Sinocyclocheilus rhinocerous TaxID=307959 RepID=A0A673JRL9_9TELE